MSRGKRDKRLKCRVHRLSYDFNTRIGDIYFAAGHCCDMQGCVDLFLGIDPDVLIIRTYAGREPDTVYRFNVGDSGEWAAYQPMKV
jgi:hypothetical protein